MTPRQVRRLALLCGVGVALAWSAAGAETPEEAITRCLELIRVDDLEAARACFDPTIQPDDAAPFFTAARDVLRIGDPPTYQVVNRSFEQTDEGGRIDTLVYHVRGETEALLLEAQTREEEQGPVVIGLRWEAAPLDLSDRFPFTLKGVPNLYYALLAAALGIPVFCGYTALLCYRRRPPRRWLWLLFILFGIGKLSVAWVPGPLNAHNVRIAPVSVQLLGAAVKKQPIYDPWVVSISLPLGAILFRRRYPDDPVPAASAAATSEGG
jgi:hypothetical protein